MKVDNRRPFVATVLGITNRKNVDGTPMRAFRTNGYRINFPGKLLLRNVKVLSITPDEIGGAVAVVEAKIPALHSWYYPNKAATVQVEISTEGLHLVG